MNKESIKEKLKTELELFKIYTALLAGLVTGDAALLLKDLSSNTKILVLFVLGIIALFLVLIMFIITFTRIIKLKQKLLNDWRTYFRTNGRYFVCCNAFY